MSRVAPGGRVVSFRTRLTLQWTAAFGLLLTVALAFVYLGARRYGFHELDLHLRTIAATELASSTDQGAPVHLHEFPRTALNDREFAPKFSQIYDRTGRVVLGSGGAGAQDVLLDAATLKDAFAGRAPLVDVVWRGQRGRMVALRTETASPAVGAANGEAAHKGPARGQPYVIAVGMLTGNLDATLTRLAWMLAGIWLVALGATAALGYGLASHALVPIDAITARAAAIARDQIEARLDPPRIDDEIGRMTRLLNAMLDRLHAVIDANRHFAADASHELRSPLTAIAGEVDVALKRERTPEEYRDTLRVIRQRLDEMFTLADNLTLLVRADHGRTREALREVPVAPLLSECRDRLAALAAERRVALRVADPPAGLVTFGDRRLLGRALDNVVGNALQYTAAGGDVAVEARYEPAAEGKWQSGEVRITVRDTGPGIPAAQWERVFDRFHRLDASRSRRTGGSGLGLPICRAILTLFGGTVQVAASSPAGTTFELTLPADLPLEGATAKTAPRLKPQTAGNAT